MKIMLKLLLALADVPFRQCFQGWTRSSFIVRIFLREDVIFSSSSLCVCFSILFPFHLARTLVRVCTRVYAQRTRDYVQIKSKISYSVLPCAMATWLIPTPSLSSSHPQITKTPGHVTPELSRMVSFWAPVGGSSASTTTNPTPSQHQHHHCTQPLHQHHYYAPPLLRSTT